MTVTVEEPDRPRARRGPGRTVAIAVAVLLVLAVAVWLFGPSSSSTDETSRSGGDTNSSTSPVAVSGLQQGTASASLDLATRKVAGVPRGFPKTVDGAVEAYAASLGTFVMGMAGMSDAELDSLVGDLMQSHLDFAPLAAEKRTLVGMNADGTVEGGAAGDTLYSACPPTLGAYKALKKSVDEVTVSYWGPCIYGTGSTRDRSRLNIVWQLTTATMHWSDGDWRLSSTGASAGAKAPRPADVDRPDTKFAVRAKLLGAGWSLFNGASQAWPTSLLGQAP